VPETAADVDAFYQTSLHEVLGQLQSKEIMLNFESPSITHGVDTTPSLLHGCYRARYAALLSPEEATEMAADAGIEEPPEGWVIHAVLSRHDLEHITQKKFLPSRLLVRHFDDGLPVVIITTQVNGLRFQWAVAMWETDAQQWLHDAVQRRRVSLLLTAIDDSASVVVTTGAGAIGQDDGLLEAVTVHRQLMADECVYRMLHAGLLLLNDSSTRFAPNQEPPLDSRVMVAGRGANALLLMDTFAAGAVLARSLQSTAGEVIQ